MRSGYGVRCGTRSTSRRIGTLLAIILATPIAFLAARNTTPSVALVRPLALLIIVASRSINALIWGLLLVIILGPGVLAGIIAIALRSIGFIGKLLYEAIEEIDESQVEAIRATGASPAQIMTYGIVPQIMPAFASISVFRWDINIRESTVLGLVGAGGLGLALEVLAQCPRLAAGHGHPDDDLRDGHRQRMGIGESSQGDHLTAVRVARSAPARPEQYRRNESADCGPINCATTKAGT